MKKNLYLFIALCMTLSFFSCSESDDTQNSLLGKWDYKSAHFEFEYAQDSISIQGMKGAIAVADVKMMFLQMANEKMGSYFKGLTFSDNSQLAIRMQMANQIESKLNATWKQSSYIQVTLDTTELKALTNGAVSQIPPISFNYQLNDNELQMFFNKDYITIVYAMMEETILNKMILPAMGLDPATAPEKVKEGIKKQIQGILQQIIRLEIGFNFTRS